MSRWRSLFSASAPLDRNPSDDRWFGGAAPSDTVHVSARTVQQLPEVYACLQLLSQTIAGLPLNIFRRTRSGTRNRDDDHPISDLLRSLANPRATAFEFRFQMSWDMLLHRNAFAEIIEGRRGPIDQLVRIDPEMIWVVRSGTDYVFEVRDGKGTTRRLLPEQVFHLRAPPLVSDNILGRSIIEDGQRTFARALALQDYAARFFQNDATPGGVVAIAGKLTPEQAREFRDKWQSQFTGRSRHKMALLDSGATFTSVASQNDKNQFLETYKEVALQCVRLYRIPPHKVGILDKATFSNIEHESQDFVSSALVPWLVAWEQSIARDLIVRPDIYFAEHNVEGLLRGDIKSRYEAYRVGREWGWLSVNEVRQRENMNPVEGGDVYLQPLNMGEAGAPSAQRASFDAYVGREVALAMSNRKLIEVRSDALR